MFINLYKINYYYFKTYQNKDKYYYRTITISQETNKVIAGDNFDKFKN